jgi:hypothetical protein
VDTFESTVGWIFDGLALLLQLFLAIPFLGRFLRWVWNVILTIVWGAIALPDAALGVLGIRPEKKLRVCTIIVNSDAGVTDLPGTVAAFVAALQNAIKIYHDEANVRIINVAPFGYTSGFADPKPATSDWVHIYDGQSPPGPLDTKCGGPALGEDLGTDGSEFEYVASTQCSFGDLRSVIGYGAPVIVFGVRSTGSDSVGCSLGPLGEYVTVLRSDPSSLPHEVGHACSLWHVYDPNNLMNPDVDNTVTGIHLFWWQVAVLRTSRHVTYF